MTDSTTLLDSLAKPPPPPSELDELMSRDPLELSAQDIDKLVAYQRQQRARREAGGGKARTKKAADEATSALSAAELVSLLQPKPTPTTPAPGSIPAVVSSFRRRL